MLRCALEKAAVRADHSFLVGGADVRLGIIYSYQSFIRAAGIQKNQKSKKLLKRKKHCDIIDKLININLRRNVGSIYTSRGKRCNNERGNSS